MLNSISYKQSAKNRELDALELSRLLSDYTGGPL